MSGSEQHPGGGFTSVDGYNDPAGSQAEADRQLREDDARRAAHERQRTQREADDRAEAERRRDQQQRERARQPASRTSQRVAKPAAEARTPQERSGGQGAVRSSWSPTTTGQHIGLVAFLAVGGFAGHRVGGEYWWVATLLAGGLAAYIGARFYKHIAGFVVLICGFWVWDRLGVDKGPVIDNGAASVDAPYSVESALPPVVPLAQPLPQELPVENVASATASQPAADEQVTHVFNINTGLVPDASAPSATHYSGAQSASGQVSEPGVYYADDIVFSYVGPPLFAAGDVLDVSQHRRQSADTGEELLETVVRHRNAIRYEDVLRFGYHAPSGTLAVYAADGYHPIGAIGGNPIAPEGRQRIQLQHESGALSPSYDVIRLQ